MVVGAPSIATDVAPTFRISLVRVGELPGAVWLAEVEDHPHFSARGATPEEAARRAWAAIEESRLAAGEAADEAPPAPPRHSGKLLVRMPATLHDELARTAESEGVSLNQLITGILASSVEWRSNGGSSRASEAARTEDLAGRSPRLMRTVLAANFALVLLAGIVAVALLLTAWLD
jgi:predicted HicB family RNase H-like nuclease